MPLQEILDAIAAEADREVASVRAKADEEVASVRARTDAEIAALDAQCEARRQRHVDAIVARIVHTARLEGIRATHAAHEEVVGRVLTGVRAGLERLRERPDYTAVLGRWLAEARATLPDGNRLRVAPSDVEAARGFAPDLAVAPDPTLSGGFVLEAPDGRSAVGTPEVRLARAEPAIRQSIARALRR